MTNIEVKINEAKIKEKSAQKDKNEWEEKTRSALYKYLLKEGYEFDVINGMRISDPSKKEPKGYFRRLFSDEEKICKIGKVEIEYENKSIKIGVFGNEYLCKLQKVIADFSKDRDLEKAVLTLESETPEILTFITLSGGPSG